jgi:hypothetical protein
MKYELGNKGEDQVEALMTLWGHTVVRSSDRYDQVKDMLIDDKTAEVKTCVPTNRIRPYAAPISISQSKKLDLVERFFIVGVYTNAICIFENHDRSNFVIQTWPDGSRSRLYPIAEQELLFVNYSPKIITEMNSLSPSKWKSAYQPQQLMEVA